jgi:putative methyltransferase (TIGR04325 family)
MYRRILAKAGRRLRLLGSAVENAAAAGQPAEQSVPQEESELPEWELLPAWLPADRLRGWDSAGVFETQAARWQQFVDLLRQPGPLGISIESSAAAGRENFWAHNLVMTYGYVLGRVLRGHGRKLKMLDWGAGSGHYYHITRTLFPDLELRYTGFDLPRLCATGRQFLPQATFVEDAGQATGERYDFVLAGSSLWYSPDWKLTLRSLAAAANPWIYLTRMIFIRQQPTCVAIQRPWRYGYDTEYQCWILNQAEFLQEAEACGLQLQREFYLGQSPLIAGLPETGAFRGFLFVRAES